MTIRFPDAAILLAAGLGTRLRPLTLSRPKPLIAVAGVPLIERVLANALAEGISSFAVNAHYHADQVAAAVADLGKRHPEVQFSLSREVEELLDTGGGARKAARLLASDPLFVFNTDSFWPEGADRPLHRMAALSEAHPDAIVLLCADPDRALGFDRHHDFFLGADARLSLDGGAPMIFAGVSLIPRACLEAEPDGPWSLAERFHTAAAEGRLLGVRLDSPWLHVGDPGGLAEAERFLHGAPA